MVGRSWISKTLTILTVSRAITSISIATPNQLISLPSLNTSLPTPSLTADDSKFVLSGRFGTENVSPLSVLMIAVSGLADLAHLDRYRRIKGFHVSNLPEYTDIDISVQPSAPAKDFQVQHAAFGIYCVLYSMVASKTFTNSTFSLGRGGVNLLQVQISNRVKPGARSSEAGTNHTVVPYSQNASLLDIGLQASNYTEGGFQNFFEYSDDPADDMLPHEVFITIMATLRSLMLEPDTDIAMPFRCGARGYNIRLDFLGVVPEPKHPPYLRIGNLIDAIKQVPGYMVSQKKFQSMLIVVAFGEEVIGEAILEKGSSSPDDDEIDLGFGLSIE